MAVVGGIGKLVLERVARGSLGAGRRQRRKLERDEPAAHRRNDGFLALGAGPLRRLVATVADETACAIEERPLRGALRIGRLVDEYAQRG